MLIECIYCVFFHRNGYFIECFSLLCIHIFPISAVIFIVYGNRSSPWQKRTRLEFHAPVLYFRINTHLITWKNLIILKAFSHMLLELLKTYILKKSILLTICALSSNILQQMLNFRRTHWQNDELAQDIFIFLDGFYLTAKESRTCLIMLSESECNIQIKRSHCLKNVTD